MSQQNGLNFSWLLKMAWRDSRRNRSRLFLFVSSIILGIAAMAGVILMVAYNLIDFKFARTVMRSSKRQTIVMVITFIATLVADLENAVFIGVIFSLVFYLQKSSTPNVAVMAPDPADPPRTGLRAGGGSLSRSVPSRARAGRAR